MVCEEDESVDQSRAHHAGKWSSSLEIRADLGEERVNGPGIGDVTDRLRCREKAQAFKMFSHVSFEEHPLLRPSFCIWSICVSHPWKQPEDVASSNRQASGRGSSFEPARAAGNPYGRIVMESSRRTGRQFSRKAAVPGAEQSKLTMSHRRSFVACAIEHCFSPLTPAPNKLLSKKSMLSSEIFMASFLVP